MRPSVLHSQGRDRITIRDFRDFNSKISTALVSVAEPPPKASVGDVLPQKLRKVGWRPTHYYPSNSQVGRPFRVAEYLCYIYYDPVMLTPMFAFTVGAPALNKH